MYAAKAVIGAVIAGVAVLTAALQTGSHTLHLVDYLLALNAFLVALVTVYLVPNKGTEAVSVADIEKMVTEWLASMTPPSEPAPVVAPAPVTPAPAPVPAPVGQTYGGPLPPWAEEPPPVAPAPAPAPVPMPPGAEHG